MKKLFLFGLFSLFCVFLYNQSIAQSDFPTAVRTCEAYSQEGSIEKFDQVFNLLITLNKTKHNKCIYKEKIFQDSNYELLTCTFEPNQLIFISNSMKEFNKVFAKEIAKNRIFEAKMTTNGQVFQKYLADPKYCTITYSKRK